MGNLRVNVSIDDGWQEEGVYEILQRWKKENPEGYSQKVCRAIRDLAILEKSEELPDGITTVRIMKTDGVIPSDYPESAPYDIDKEIQMLMPAPVYCWNCSAELKDGENSDTCSNCDGGRKIPAPEIQPTELKRERADILAKVGWIAQQTEDIDLRERARRLQFKLVNHDIDIDDHTVTELLQMRKVNTA